MPVPHIEETAKKLPLLRWTGGKRRLVSQILPLVPSSFNRYCEPFFGGGAFFFALEPRIAVLSDLNSELIDCYKQIRDSPEQVILHLSRYVNSSDEYYRIREYIPVTSSEKAARLIYLTTLSFNGIYRLNQRGLFNVPYGQRTHVNPCDASKIMQTSKTLSGTELISGDFADVLTDATEGDLIYFDPPYTVAHQNNGFVKYNDRIFLWQDQIRLANLAKELSNRGCYVIVSNANHACLRDLYDGFEVKVITRNSIMAASSVKRGLVTECVFYNKL